VEPAAHLPARAAAPHHHQDARRVLRAQGGVIAAAGGGAAGLPGGERAQAARCMSGPGRAGDGHRGSAACRPGAAWIGAACPVPDICRFAQGLFLFRGRSGLGLRGGASVSPALLATPKRWHWGVTSCSVLEAGLHPHPTGPRLTGLGWRGAPQARAHAAPWRDSRVPGSSAPRRRPCPAGGAAACSVFALFFDCV
jgi:hypothetical protein